jgi:hypothetical protein
MICATKMCSALASLSAAIFSSISSEGIPSSCIGSEPGAFDGPSVCFAKLSASTCASFSSPLEALKLFAIEVGCGLSRIFLFKRERLLLDWLSMIPIVYPKQINNFEGFPHFSSFDSATETHI